MNKLRIEETQGFLEFRVLADSDLNLIVRIIDEMRPAPKPIICTQREIDEFAGQQYREYGQVWSMPVEIRDRIRALRTDGRQTSRSRRRKIYPRVCNTGVTSGNKQ